MSARRRRTPIRPAWCSTPRFLPGLRVSVDYFDISLEGAIAPLGGGLNNTLNLCYNVIQDANSEFCQAVRRDPNGAINDPFSVQILQANTGELETSGVDIALRYTSTRSAGGQHRLQQRLDLDRRVHLTPVSGLPEHPEQLRRLVGPDLRRADPGMARHHPRHLELGHIQPQPARTASSTSVTNDRYILPLRSGANAAGARQPVLSGAAVAQLFRPRRDDRRHRGRPALWRRAQHPRREAAGRRHPQVRANTWPATYDVLGTEFFFGAIFRF